MESITQNGIWDSRFRSIIVDDLDILFADKLFRRNELEAPIPVGLTKVLSRLYPILLVDSEFGSGLYGSGLKELLLSTISSCNSG